MPTRWLAFLSTNPYQDLLATSWHYARGQRGRYVLIYVLCNYSGILASRI